MNMDDDKKDYDILYIIKYDKIIPRTVATLIQSPKLFFAAFLWQGFATFAVYLGYDAKSAMYALLAGIGDFLGVMVGGLIIIIAFQYKGEQFDMELHNSLLVAIASGIVAGSLWQLDVNISVDQGWNFNEAFWFLAAISLISYVTAVFFLRWLNQNISEDYRLRIDSISKKTLYFDALFALTLGIADGFFLGTDIEQWPDDDWLKAFAIYPDYSVIVGMSLAGSAVLTGFIIAQTAQNLFLPSTWVDADMKKDILIRNASTLFLSQVDLRQNAGDRDNERSPLVKLPKIDEDANEVGLSVE